MKTVAELRDEVSGAAAAARATIRRMTIALTSSVLWQIVGFLNVDNTQEVRNAEPFTGIGLTSRPPTNGKPEAIVVFVGGELGTPIIVAVRDQQTRAAIVNALNPQADETVLHNSQAVVYVKADGTIEARLANGAAQTLAFAADAATIGSFIAAVYAAAHGAAPGPAAAAAVAAAIVTWGTANPTWVSAPPTAPVGTTQLKGQ